MYLAITNFSFIRLRLASINERFTFVPNSFISTCGASKVWCKSGTYNVSFNFNNLPSFIRMSIWPVPWAYDSIWSDVLVAYDIFISQGCNSFKVDGRNRFLNGVICIGQPESIIPIVTYLPKLSRFNLRSSIVTWFIYIG